MICYNLVFNWKIFKKNAGSIISLIFFIIYLGFIIYFILKGIQPIQIAISKIMFVEMRPDLVDQKYVNGIYSSTNANNKLKNKNKKGKKVKIKANPPKKENARKANNITIVKDPDNTKISTFTESKKLKSSQKLMTTPGKSKNALNKNKFNKELIFTEGANLKKKDEITKAKEEEIMSNLDNFQLNNLEYLDACKYDTRPFLKTYHSVLMREHIILFTFFSWNDYNLFYVKIERLLVLICTQMTMNGLFFSDESMKKANKSDDYNFVQQLPKII